MSLRFRLPPRAIAAAALLAACPALSGCSGVVKNLNSAQVSVPNVNIANPFGLDNQGATVLLTNPVVIGAAGARPAPHDVAPNVYPFPKVTASLGGLSSATLRLGLKPVVALTSISNGGGADPPPPPASFILRTFTVTAEVDDLAAPGGAVADRVTLPAAAIAGPVSFTLKPDGSGYTADDPAAFHLSPIVVQGAALTSLVNVLTGEHPNKQVIVTLTGASAGVLAGTPMTVTFAATSLTVSAGQ